MIKGDGKNERHHEQDHELGGDDVREDCAHKKPVLTLEKRHAGGAVMPDVKRLRDDPRGATGRTTQLQTPPEDFLDLFKIYFQGLTYLTLQKGISHAAARRRNVMSSSSD